MTKITGQRPAKPAPWYADFKLFLLILITFAVFLVLSFYGGFHLSCDKFGLVGLKTGSAAPDFEVEGLDGARHRLSDFKGKVVFLNFWATWCAPCREEVPAIQSLHKKFLKQSDFVIMAIACDQNGRSDVEKFLSGNIVTFPVYLDSETKIAMEYGVSGFPETFIIDRSGKVAQKFIGPRDWDSPRFQELVEKLLKGN